MARQAKASNMTKRWAHKRAVAKRKAFAQEIKDTNDNNLKNTVADMKYTLNIRSQMRSLNPEEIHAWAILKEANTKKKRFCAIGRVKHIVYN